VVSLYVLTGSLSPALADDADWRPYFLEGYLFIGAIYSIGCFTLSRYSQRLQARLARNSVSVKWIGVNFNRVGKYRSDATGIKPGSDSS